MELGADQIKSNIKFISKSLGFSDCRIAKVKPATHGSRFREWVADGTAGDMKWLERNVERRINPNEVLEGAKSMVCLALNYYPGEQDSAHENGYKIARYAWNEDYHDIIDDKLRDLNIAMEELGGQQRFYVDTGPVLERDFASDAGLGWNGKSTVQIHKSLGTWTFLCELITTFPREMDARRCISYLTIENKSSIPLELRPLMGDRIYGCDVCLEVCPWNRFAKISQETKLHAKAEIFEHKLEDFLSITENEFRTIFAKSPIKRIKRPAFLRNVCVAIGNRGSKADLPALEQLLLSEDNELIKEHAEWAMQQIVAT